ncbi:MAG: tyrosine--tRNA ligase [Blastopirellula sp.]|nr:MAG: tyrosine--tRNA ligase [Blastopirellula sp.]
MNDIFAELKWRGLIFQTTDEENLQKWLLDQSRTIYAGFDPTADSLHVGSLLPLMILRRFQKCGHRPIALVGGATGMIGDPSGKSAERNLLSVDQLRANVVGIQQQMKKVLDFDNADSGAVLVNNFDWMSRFSFLDFLRDIGKNFPVNVMMGKESVKNRLQRDDLGISYTEFSYMLLQAYDFVHLNKEHGCELQVGGSDQWGNITAGIDLGRRMLSQQLYGMTCPLLTKADGTKMGKTESGAIWLSPERTSPYAFYQYWINVADEDAGKCLRFLTELNQEEIEALDKAREEEAYKRESQRRLAEELTGMIHGPEGLASAQRATKIFFGEEIDNLSDSQLVEIFADVSSKDISKERLSGEGLNLMDAFVEAGLSKSKGEARRTVQQGGAYINNRRRESIDERLTAEDLASETVMVLRSGKKKYALLRFRD